MDTLHGKNLGQPDETRTFPLGKVDLVLLGDVTVGRLELQPGWRWSESVKPLAGTESCQAAHTGYNISGRMHVKMDDGTEAEYGPGDAYVIPPGHDAWVVGDEPVIGLDFTGMREYAKAGATAAEQPDHPAGASFTG
jgi:hypothetical protein